MKSSKQIQQYSIRDFYEREKNMDYLVVSFKWYEMNIMLHLEVNFYRKNKRKS